MAFFLELIKNFEFVTISKVITNEKTNSNKEVLREVEQSVKELNLVNEGELKTRSAKSLPDEL